MASLPSLVLASASPRRQNLLATLGLHFLVRSVDIDETPRAGEAPEAYVRRLAEEKGAAKIFPGELVLAADTSVILDGEILGKPTDEADAREMIGRLAGREHTVLTGVALAELGRERRTVVESSQVRIATLDAEEIAWYVATGEPMDKAGSYAAQGLGAMFIDSIAGDYTNVVGLPLAATRRLFAAAGYDLKEFRR